MSSVSERGQSVNLFALLVSGARHDPGELREHLGGTVRGELVPA